MRWTTLAATPLAWSSWRNGPSNFDPLCMMQHKRKCDGVWEGGGWGAASCFTNSIILITPQMLL